MTCVTRVPGAQSCLVSSRCTAVAPRLVTLTTAALLMAPVSEFWPPPSGKRTVSRHTTSHPLMLTFFPLTSNLRVTGVQDTTSDSNCKHCQLRKNWNTRLVGLPLWQSCPFDNKTSFYKTHFSFIFD